MPPFYRLLITSPFQSDRYGVRANWARVKECDSQWDRERGRQRHLDVTPQKRKRKIGWQADGQATLALQRWSLARLGQKKSKGCRLVLQPIILPAFFRAAACKNLVWVIQRLQDTYDYARDGYQSLVSPRSSFQVSKQWKFFFGSTEQTEIPPSLHSLWG